MQNTSRIQNIPNTLIKNFFIAGVNQKTLITKILEGKAYKIPPEVLFTMYHTREHVQNYLQFVFPEMVAVEYSAYDPKFYTFMMTDSDGFNSFFHVLIFYEEINEAEISLNDFDIVTEILRKQHLNKKMTRKHTSANKSPNMRDGSTGELNKGELFAQYKKKMIELHKRKLTAKGPLNCKDLCKIQVKKDTPPEDANETVRTPKASQNLDQQMKHRLKRRELEQTKKQKMDQLMQNINAPSNMAVSGLQSLNHTTIQQPIDAKAVMQNKSWFKSKTKREFNFNKDSSTSVTAFNGGKQAFGRKETQQTDKDEILLTEDSQMEQSHMNESVNFSKATRFVTKKLSLDKKKAMDDYYGTKQPQQYQVPRFGQTAVGNNEEPVIGSAKVEIEFDEEYFDNHVLYFEKQTSAFPDSNNIQEENDEQFQQLYEKKRYVPVALVLETETEYHDMFRQILLSLFDLIRVPDNLVNNRVIDNRIISFAELISHLAFMKTIPAPPFNSVYNIHCLNQVFTIKESSFDQIPHKNQFPIKILFDVLDVRSIFYCWKALLFDKSLVLVSTQYSLQFYVAEALKQLLFPMTWQNSYIQPGNESLSGHADGTFIMIYGSNSMVNGFDFFDGISPEMAVCDIDACYTNNITMPVIPDEQMFVRILNTLKNSRINQYDKAYPDSQLLDAEDFVQQVRETFFSLLKPFLQKVEDFIDTTVETSGAFFQKYFKVDEYLNFFEAYGECHHRFAVQLVTSSQFIHFCDDYFSDELNNFQMLKEILRARGELHSPNESSNFRQKSNILENINFDEVKKKRKNLWPDTDPVVFNFRLPQGNQRVLLFEKLLYMIEDSMRKREEDVTRKTNEDLIQNRDNLKYEKIIQDIRTLYPIKLKGTHKRYQVYDQKIVQQNYLRKLNANSTVDQISKMMRKPISKQSSDVLNVVMIEGDKHRQSILEAQRLNKRFNQTNIQHTQHFTPTSNVKSDNNVPLQDQSMQQLKLQLNFVGNQTKSPLEMSTSHNGGEDLNQSSSFAQNSLHNSLFEQEQFRVQNCERRISRLMYGKSGLITFLNHLFGLLNEKQMRQVNYYFALKEQIKTMNEFEKAQKKRFKDLRMNTSIQEDHNEEDKSPWQSKPTPMQNRISQEISFNDKSRSPPEMSPRTMIQRRGRIYSQGKQIAAATNSTSSTALSTFKNDKEWFNLEQWDIHAYSLKHTYQFVLFKTKMYEAFECPEDGYSYIWKELLAYPTYKMKYFPRSKFMNIWENLTQSQQQEIFIKVAQKQNKPCIQMISKEYLKTRSIVSKSTAVESSYQRALKSDETLFYGASITKSYVQKKQEKKDLMSKQNTCKFESSPFNLASTVKKCESVVKKDDKTKRFFDTSSKSINDLLKQKLSQRLANDSTSKKSSFTALPHKMKPPPLTHRSQTHDEHISFQKETSLTPTVINKMKSSNDYLLDKGAKTFARHSKDDTVSIAVDYDMRQGSKKKETTIKRLKDAEDTSRRMLEKVVDMWKNESKWVDKRGKFQEKELERIQAYFTTFDKYLLRLKSSEPVFDDDIHKQVFFLNLFNFLVLYQLAVLMLSQPEAIEKLTNYSMWQSFLVSASLKIGGHKVNAYTIQHSILRKAFKQPKITEFILTTPAKESPFPEYQVKAPNKLLCFGFFMPLKGFPMLRVFSSKEFDNQLRLVAQQYLVKRIKIKDEFNLIQLPMIIQWYRKDFCDKYLTDLLTFIEENIYQGKSQSAIPKILEKLGSKLLHVNELTVVYKCSSWEFKPSKMQMLFPDMSGPAFQLEV